MKASTPPTMTRVQREAAHLLGADLQRIFGSRLQSLVAYGMRDAPGHDDGLHTLALVDRIAFQDLSACAPCVERWQDGGLAVPLLLTRNEFERSLDVFPLEYGEILRHHIAILGEPLTGAHIAEADLRRACELQAKSHLIHLREGYLESAGDSRRVVGLIASAGPALRGLLEHIHQLEGEAADKPASDDELAAFAERSIGVDAGIIRQVLGMSRASGTIADPTALLAPYLSASERIWAHVDRWKQR